jgi:hypothetical protein
MAMNRNDYEDKKLQEKRKLIKEMAREIYMKEQNHTDLTWCVRQARKFYDNIEAELDRALGGEE